jgi:hypothetical protein
LSVCTAIRRFAAVEGFGQLLNAIREASKAPFLHEIPELFRREGLDLQMSSDVLEQLQRSRHLSLAELPPVQAIQSLTCSAVERAFRIALSHRWIA